MSIETQPSQPIHNELIEALGIHGQKDQVVPAPRELFVQFAIYSATEQPQIDEEPILL